MYIKHVSYLSLIIGIILLPACGPRYHKRNLKVLTNKNSEYVSTKNGITARAHVLTPNQTKTLFDGRGAQLTKEPIKVVHLAFTNTTDIPLILLPDNIGLSLLSDKLIKELCYDKTVSYVGSYALKGLGVASVIAALTCAPLAFGVVPLGYYLAIAGGGISGAIVTSTPVVSYVQTSKKVVQSNNQMYSDITKKMLVESKLIASGTTQDCLLFVFDKLYRSKFAVTLVDQCSKDIQTFNIKL